MKNEVRTRTLTKRSPKTMDSSNEQPKANEIPIELLQQFGKEFEGTDTTLVGEKLSNVLSHAVTPAKDTLKAMLSQAINNGVMPKNALHINDETMEAMYGQAYNLYNQGKYKDASYIFRLLMLLDYVTPKYILGLAASLHKMKDYKNAANVYLLCGTLDAHNPLPHYHAADCYIQLGIPAIAAFSLGMAIEIAGDQPQFSVIKERAKLMQHTLMQEMNKTSSAQVAPQGQPKKAK